RGDQHDRRHAVGTQRDAKRRRQPAERIDDGLARSTDMERDSAGQRKSERRRIQGGALGSTASGRQREDRSGNGQQDRQNEQVPAWRCPQFFHQFVSPPCGLVQTSGFNVTWLLSERRKISATAMELAAKATTIPVMTIACGIGSKRKPAAAPRRATMPKTRKTPLPMTLKASNLRSGCGWRM